MNPGRKILLITIILIALLIVAGFGFVQTRRMLVRREYTERKALASLSASIIDAKLNHLEDLGKSMAAKKSLQQFVAQKNWEEAIHTLKEIPDNFSCILQISVSNDSGIIMKSATEKGTPNKSEPKSDWYRGVSKNWQPYLSGVYKRPDNTLSRVADFAIPIKTVEGKPTGILIMQIDIAQLFNWTDNIKIGQSGSVYVADQNGHLVAYPGNKNSDEILDYSSVPAVQKAFSGKKNAELLYTPVKKQKQLSVYEKIPKYNWVILVQQEAGAALFLNNSLLPMAIFYLFIIMILIISAWFIIRQIERNMQSAKELHTYASVIEESNVLVTNMKDEILFWNKGMEKLYGWEKNEAIGQFAYKLFSAKFSQPLQEIKNDLLRNDEWHGESTHFNKYGKLLTISSHWKLQRDKRGEPVAVLETNNDITCLHETKKDLKKSREIYQLLMANVKDYAIIIMNINGIITNCSSGAEQVKGYTEDEIIGKSFEIFYPKDDIQKGEPALNLEIARQYGNYESEGWRVRKDGTLFWANVVFTALKDEDGNLYGFAKITRDVTERKKAQEQQELLSMQINQSHDAIYTLNTDQKIANWNLGAENLYGYARCEAVGKSPNELLKTVISEEESNAAMNTVSEKNYWKGDLKRITKSGKEIYVHATTTAVKNEKGNIVGYIATSFDITKEKMLKEKADHLAIMVENSSEAIITRGLDNRIISWNSGAEKLFGYKKEEAIGKTITELEFIKLSPEEIRDIEILISENGRWETEMNYYNKSGLSFYGTVTGNGIKDETGNLTCFIFIIRDISQRKKLEDELKNWNQELEKKVEERAQEVYKNELRFRSLIENSEEGITLTDRKFNLIFKSPSAEKILRNESFSDLNRITHPDDLEKMKALREKVLRNPDKPFAFEGRFTFGDQKYIWLEGSITNHFHLKGVEAIVTNFHDITERKEAENNILLNEEKYRTFIQRVTDAFIAIDKNWRYTYLNKHAGDIIHMNPDDLIGKNVWEVFPDAVGSPTYQAFQKAMQQQCYVSNIDYYPPLDLWQENHIYPSENGLSVFIRDITEKKKAEEELRKSNERFELVTSATNDIIWDWDIATNKFWWNKNYYSHFGYDMKNTLPDVNSWQNGVYPEDRTRVISGIRDSIEKKRDFWTDEYRFLKANGTVAYVLDCGYILYNDNRAPYRMVGAMLDITGRRRAEEQLEKNFIEKQMLAERMSTILNTLPANIVLLNSNHIIIEVNEGWKKLVSENADWQDNNFMGEDYLKIARNLFRIEEKDCRVIARGVKNVISNKATEFVYEYTSNHHDIRKWYRMIVTPLHEKQTGGAVVMNIDISELRKLEQERLESKTAEQKKIARAMLRAQEKERSAIGADLHDNVNQILAGTNLFLSIAKRNPEKCQEYLETSMNHIQLAIEQNRKMAHELVAPDFDIIPLIDLLTNLTDNMLKNASISVNIDSKNLEENWLTDEQKLAVYRISQEQCTNIIKYAEAKSVSLRLLTTKDVFEMVISDDGKGMKTGKKINGIGMRNIKGRLTVLDGEVNVCTSPGKGFILSVKFPLQNMNENNHLNHHSEVKSHA